MREQIRLRRQNYRLFFNVFGHCQRLLRQCVQVVGFFFVLGCGLRVGLRLAGGRFGLALGLGFADEEARARRACLTT